MINAWIVVREEKHIDNKFWICLNRENALRIASIVTQYWCNKYQPKPDQIDEKCYGDLIFHFDAEDCFRIFVQPQIILEYNEDSGEDQ